MSKLYKYRLPNGYFVGEIPNFGKTINTVEIAPVLTDGFWPRWPIENPNATEWEQVEDHRGTQGYLDGEPHEIKDLGPLPDGFSLEPPPPSLEQARTEALEALRLKKWERKDAGITVNGVAIDTDDKGQATLSGALLNCLVDPGYMALWKTAAVDSEGKSVWLTIDSATIHALCRAVTEYTQACFSVEAAKQESLAAIMTVDTVKAWLETELDTGWPSREIVVE